MNTPKIVYNFDEWKDLYKQDPEGFNTLKNAYIKQEIIKLCRGDPEAEKRCFNLLNGQNMQLDRLKNPLSRMAKMEQLLYESLFKLNDALHGIVPSTSNAKIIPFKNK